jgi:predicted acylesterase/phospholipase RssA
MGADFVIAVDVASRWVSIPSDDLEDLKQTKNMYDFVHQLMTGLQYNIAKHVLEKADTVIKVPLTTFSWMEFNRAAEIIKRGEDGAREKLKEIRKKSGYENKIKRSVLEKFMINLFGE